MSSPTTNSLFDAIDATWAPRSMHRAGDWVLRDGGGGGNRVSAASFHGQDPATADISQAEAAMIRSERQPLFMVRPGQEDLDRLLIARNYKKFAPVNIYTGVAGKLAEHAPTGLAALPCAAPLAIQKEIWAEGGIGPERLAIMTRVSSPKTMFLARNDNHPAGTAFVAIHKNIGMLHALEVRRSARRKGVGADLTRAAARWCAEQGAQFFAVLVTRENLAGNALYARIGMEKIAQYHYRRSTG